MKLIKIDSKHTTSQMNEIVNNMSSFQIERVENLYRQFDYVDWENVDGTISSIISIPESLIGELYGTWASISPDFSFKTIDLTKDALFGKIDTKSFGLSSDKLSQLDYILDKFIESNIDIDVILDKINELGIGSLTQKDILILQSI